MEKRRLYDANSRYTEEALKLDLKIFNALRPVLSEAIESGVDLRDLQSVADNALRDYMLNALLGWQQVERS